MAEKELSGKKIWIDVEEPKTGIMFKSLFEMFEKAGAELLITARDFDSTFNVMDDVGTNYLRIGSHGGATLENKLNAYIERLDKLFPIVTEFDPDYFVTFSSVEGPRISFGLGIPSIGINDEPRNQPVCKLIFPLLDEIITPSCIPQHLYEELHATPEKIIRYNGIDEIGWLSTYQPNPNILEKHDLHKGKFVLIRSEMSSASYFVGKLKTEETKIAEFLPEIVKKFPNHKYIVLIRSPQQKQWLTKQLGNRTGESDIIITQYMPNIVDLCFYSALVISGGGTIVRESSLLGVPSIEFFPGETAPQEKFLMQRGFPMHHIKTPENIIKKSSEILENGPEEHRFKDEFKKKIEELDNPNVVLFNRVKDRLKTSEQSR